MLEGIVLTDFTREFWNEVGALSPVWLCHGFYVEGCQSPVPSIPAKKLANARSSYAPYDLEHEQILALYDSTVFGGAKRGLVLTDRRIYIKASAQAFGSIDLKHLDAITVKHGTLKANNLGVGISTSDYRTSTTAATYFDCISSGSAQGFEKQLKLIWQPSTASPMLKELKTLGVKDDLLYGLINRAKIDEAVVTHHGPLIFTQHRLINTKLGRSFEFEGGAAVVATIDNLQHGHSNAPHALGQAIKHPTPFWLIVAAFTAFVESAESASPKQDTYIVDLVKTSGVRYRMLDSCSKDEMIEIETLSALVGLPFSVEVRSGNTRPIWKV